MHGVDSLSGQNKHIYTTVQNRWKQYCGTTKHSHDKCTVAVNSVLLMLAHKLTVDLILTTPKTTVLTH